MKALLCLTVSLAAAATAATLAVPVQPPILFERWEAPPLGASGYGVDFGLTPGNIYQKYAAQMLIGLPITAKAHKQKDKRLMDIEIRSNGSGLAIYVYDVVWVRNEGSFLIDSWLVTGMKADEVELFEHFDDVILLDLERYPQGQEWRFSAIVQRNSGKFDWQVHLGISSQTATQIVHNTGYRVVDVDRHLVCPPRQPTGQTCPVFYDMVIVKNTGTNFMQTIDLFQSNPPYAQPGFQLVDMEINDLVAHVTNWVLPANPYVRLENQTQNDVITNMEQRGRVIDLEVREEAINGGPLSTFKYSTVNITNQ